VGSVGVSILVSIKFLPTFIARILIRFGRRLGLIDMAANRSSFGLALRAHHAKHARHARYARLISSLFWN
jgi:hypothetical protein